MITMMGIIDFNNEMAPDIFLRLGDTGRETSLVPADPVALEGLTASLYMAKPDNTFVIAACTISDDSIIISWPEQAAAVKGFGEYCIRLKDSNDLVIYSARGNVIIDDHVITDSMIESIAEANGYVFPDDFALKDEIPDIEDIIDDDDIIDNKTWSSWKIDDLISSLDSRLRYMIDDDHIADNTTWSSNKINSIVSYSTTEKKIGSWIDGRELYQITKQKTGTFNSNIWYSIDLGTGNEIVEIVNCVFIAANGGRVPIHYYRAADEYCTGDSVGSVFEFIQVGLNSTVSVEVTLRYVKQ